MTARKPRKFLLFVVFLGVECMSDAHLWPAVVPSNMPRKITVKVLNQDEKYGNTALSFSLVARSSVSLQIPSACSYMSSCA